MNLILISMGVLGVIAFLAAVLLYVVSLYFKVEEDPRIDLVTAVLPGANCGGCGFAGCRNFAEACVKAGGIDGLACPVGGEPTMEQVKLILVPLTLREGRRALTPLLRRRSKRSQRQEQYSRM